MKIFLSGKVDEAHGAWRDSILGVDLMYQPGGYVGRPRWIIYSKVTDIQQWGTKQKIVLGEHDYIGPYRQVWQPGYDFDSSHFGYFHGIEGDGAHGQMDWADEAKIVGQCSAGIRDADLIFAYINSPDAYGTLAEIGYAAALGKFITVLIKPGTEFDYTDFWFAKRLASKVLYWNHLWDIDRGDAPSESMIVRDAMKDAIIAYAANPPRIPGQITEHVAMQAVADSFAQIEQWTSDPRVRNEAQRMRKQISRR